MSQDPPANADLRAMSGERLRTEGRRIDRKIGAELDRVRMADAQFRTVLDRSLAVEDEIAKRKTSR